MLKRLGDWIGLTTDAEKKMLAKMTVADVIDAHMKWKLALQEYVDGDPLARFDLAATRHEERSLAGKWIHQHAARHLSAYGAFFTVRTKHAQCHLLANQVVDKVLQGNRAEADALMKERLFKMSHEVIYALVELDRQLESEE